MSFEYPCTVITYDSNREIVALDTYIPVVESGTVEFGIDLKLFTELHPLKSQISIDQTVENEAGGGMSQVVCEAGADSLEIHDDVLSGELEVRGNLAITQHIGTLHAGGMAVAAWLGNKDTVEHNLLATMAAASSTPEFQLMDYACPN